MIAIKNLRLLDNGKSVVWNPFGRSRFLKFFSTKIRFVFTIWNIVELKDESGFAIVASDEEFAMHNLLIFNVDSTLRFRILNPFNEAGNYPCFNKVSYIDDNLTCTLKGKNGFKDLICIIDENTGELRNLK